MEEKIPLKSMKETFEDKSIVSFLDDAYGISNSDTGLGSLKKGTNPNGFEFYIISITQTFEFHIRTIIKTDEELIY